MKMIVWWKGCRPVSKRQTGPAQTLWHNQSSARPRKTLRASRFSVSVALLNITLSLIILLSSELLLLSSRS
ncbi:hypothetical protein ECSTECMHI813_0935 [Escherichia coli STEC_MHI813]|nr:hypothetical protein ECSTECMHI813_0935 [Escherichia coli STEC_MHI813]